MTCKRGDTQTITFTAGGDLTQATAVRVLVSARPGDIPVITRTVPVNTITTANGQSTFQTTLTSVETNRVGLFYVEVEATGPGQNVTTWPSTGYLNLLITDDLGGA